MLDFIREESIWKTLPQETRPIVLYGMGDGALKVLDRCRQYGIPVAGIFASDEFVRGQTFEGFPVRSLKEMEDLFGDFVVLLCFAAFLPPLMEKILAIGRRHTLLAPDVPVFGGGLFTDEYLFAHQAQLEAAYDLLADEQSRLVFRSVVNFRLSGKLCWLTGCESPRKEVFSRLLQLGSRERYLDLGAYDGDTLREFFGYTGEQAELALALEPDPKNFRKLQKAAEALPETVRLLNAAVWEHDAVRSFDGRAGRSSSLSETGRLTVPVRSIDSLWDKYGPFTYIKMDVEGAERQALLGARESLRRHYPKLLFSGYHRTEDLFSLPLLLHELAPDYRITLRHHPYFPAWETNFCAVPNGR
ncbi:MAG: FkbM family methyltransferase [Oscillospiraceae bacterium]|nr:FkbM family methyltransferase [Oscillospiraceae bacterium]